MKFRVWDKRTKTMHHDSFALTPNGRLLRVVEYTDWDYEEVTEGDFAVMFSTGVTDRDGKEIWEGDIVHTSWGATEVITPAIWKWCRDYHHNLKVLGNRWQNPELLEKGDG